ncbi:MAG TPA: helix-turn-helix domain-containing protein [Usitatibacter sp.]|nr:helix-turn-helix domain-containing protein [Usitatibacter sp.]
MEEAGANPTRDETATLGGALAAERERQGLSRADVAHRLHMSPIQVEAIEVGDYAHLPKGTFLRGFVRNYAKALGIAAEPLLEKLAGTVPAGPTPGIVVPTQNIRFDPLGERLSSPYVKAATLALVAIAVGFAVMYWAMYVRPHPPALALRSAARHAPAPAPRSAPGETKGAAAEPAAGARSAQPGPITASGADAKPTPAAEVQARIAAAPAKTKEPSAKPVAPSAKAAPDGASIAAAKPSAAAPESDEAAAADASPRRRLHFHFAGDSWVEVRDANGKVLFQRLNAAGTEAQVSGHPPLQVVVGNAPEVEMTLDGKPFDLDPHTEVAVARFTLE